MSKITETWTAIKRAYAEVVAAGRSGSAERLEEARERWRAAVAIHEAAL